jgi:hypothetical protein
VSQYNDGGCEPGHAILVRSQQGGYNLRTCGTRIPCGDGAFCSARLMDVASRCCIASRGEKLTEDYENGWSREWVDWRKVD